MSTATSSIMRWSGRKTVVSYTDGAVNSPAHMKPYPTQIQTYALYRGYSMPAKNEIWHHAKYIFVCYIKFLCVILNLCSAHTRKSRNRIGLCAIPRLHSFSRKVVLYCIVLYCIVLYCIVLYCIVFFF